VSAVRDARADMSGGGPRVVLHAGVSTLSAVDMSDAVTTPNYIINIIDERPADGSGPRIKFEHSVTFICGRSAERALSSVVDCRLSIIVELLIE